MKPKRKRRKRSNQSAEPALLCYTVIASYTEGKGCGRWTLGCFHSFVDAVRCISTSARIVKWNGWTVVNYAVSTCLQNSRCLNGECPAGKKKAAAAA